MCCRAYSLGLLSSILLMVYRTSRPHLSSLGRVPGVAGAFSGPVAIRKTYLSQAC